MARKNNKVKFSKKMIITLSVLIVLVIGVLVGAFIIFYNKPDKVEERDFHGGEIELTYSDDANLFMIEKAIPTSDISGIKYDSADLFFDFTVKATLDEADSLEYDVIIVKSDSLSTIDEKNIKLYLEKENNGEYVKVAGPKVFSNNVESDEYNSAMKLYSQKKIKSGNDNYRLRMWVADTAVLGDDELKNFAVKIAIKGKAN